MEFISITLIEEIKEEIKYTDVIIPKDKIAHIARCSNYHEYGLSDSIKEKTNSIIVLNDGQNSIMPVQDTIYNLAGKLGIKFI